MDLSIYVSLHVLVDTFHVLSFVRFFATSNVTSILIYSFHSILCRYIPYDSFCSTPLHAIPFHSFIYSIDLLALNIFLIQTNGTLWVPVQNALHASTQAVSAPTILWAPGRTRSPCQRSSWLEVQLSTMWIAFDWCELKQDVTWPLARKNIWVKSELFIGKMILVGWSWNWTAGILPEVLGVSCAAGYQGAELGNSLPVSSELLTCVDGTWLDSKGRRTPTVDCLPDSFIETQIVELRTSRIPQCHCGHKWVINRLCSVHEYILVWKW